MMNLKMPVWKWEKSTEINRNLLNLYRNPWKIWKCFRYLPDISYPKSPKSPCPKNSHLHQQMSAFQLDLGQWPPEVQNKNGQNQTVTSTSDHCYKMCSCQDRVASQTETPRSKEHSSTKLFTTLRICMYLCMYVRMYTNVMWGTYIHTYIHTYIYIYMLIFYKDAKCDLIDDICWAPPCLLPTSSQLHANPCTGDFLGRYFIVWDILHLPSHPTKSYCRAARLTMPTSDSACKESSLNFAFVRSSQPVQDSLS